MPKSKKKKRDFQKVKLKVGKERRMGNETDLSFKTRTIKVTQALKDNSTRSEEAKTKKKLTFEDLMKRCDANKNRTQRLSAVEGLRELALATEGSTSQASFWRSKFCEVMRSVATLFSDPEPVVRQRVIQLCRTLFSVVGGCSINVDVFGTHLCCSMGHISDGIRRDTLAIFDILLEMCPESLMDKYCTIVPAFVRQLTSSGTLSPRNKISSQKYRAGVLLRLDKIVQIRFSDDPKTQGLSLCTPHRSQKPWIDWLASRRGEPQDYSEIDRYPKQLEKFIASVLPVIKDCWHDELTMENSAGPTYSVADSSCGGPLSQDSLPRIQTVVDLLYTLVECWRLTDLREPNLQDRFRKSHWFRTVFLGELRNLLLPQFPIAVTEMLVKGGRNQPSTGRKGRHNHGAAETDPSAQASSLQTSVLKLNLKVCEMMASFPPNQEDWPEIWVNPEDWQEEIVTFMLKNLKRCVKSGLITPAIRVLREIFFHFPYTDKVGRLLERAQNRFVSAHLLSVEKRKLLQLLDDLAFDLEQSSPYHAATAHLDGSPSRHELLGPYLQALPQIVLELCGVENVEEIALPLTTAMCYKDSTVLTEAVRCHMPQLLDNKTGPFAKLPKSCHYNLYLATNWAYFDVPVPEPILEQMESIIRHPNVDNAICRKFAWNFSDLYHRLQVKVQRDSSLTELRPLVEASEKSYRRFMFSLVVGHKTVELEAMDRANQPEIPGLTHVVWTCSLEQFEKHVFTMDSIFHNFRYFFKRHAGGSVNGSSSVAHVTEIMAQVWNVQIMKKYGSLSILTVWSALSHWRHMLRELREGDVLHIDNAPCPPNVKGEETWRGTVRDVLPVLKANKRSFTHLTFALLHSLVAMETGKEAVAVPAERMVGEMWRVVVSLMELSFRMLLDLLRVVTDFVQEQQSELESRRVVLLITKLLAAEEVDRHKVTYPQLLRPELEALVAAVKSVTADIETRQWWSSFVTALDLSSVANAGR
ncbi:hypothetical protein ACOMHN_008113 [Nucella lapillus]